MEDSSTVVVRALIMVPCKPRATVQQLFLSRPAPRISSYLPDPMPPKKPKTGQAKFKQATLFGLLSSPMRSPLQKSKSKRVKDQESAPSVSPTKRKRGHDAVKHASDGGESDSDVGGIKFEPKVLVDEAKPSPSKRRQVVVDSDDEISSGSPVLVTKKLNVRSRSLKSSKVKGSSNGQRGQQISDSESDIPVVRRNRLRRGPRPSSPPEQQEEDDELEEEHILESRLRSRHRKTAFQRNLEKLKRKKQGRPVESIDSEEQEDESENDGDTPFKDAQPDSENDSLFDESEHSDKSSDFIVEDDGDGVALLPAEFRPQQDLAHQFKIVFQFFVHIAVHPAVERHKFMKRAMKDDYFSVALISARRKLIGLRDSLVASSVWRPEFKKSLETCPDFNLYKLDFALPQCDACHLGGRLSTLRGQLGGSPYDPLGFQDQPDESKGSDDEDNEEQTHEFYFGRFCAKRTRIYHEISHWEYKLFKSVENEVDELHVHKQSGRFVRVAYAGGMKPPEDLDDADGICEWLDERKIIDIEWQNIKELMERARQLESGANGDDSD
ncbi:uncharacterized protein BT62DRAFT_998533 [Guyanagaster necrorhizus]|uniref:DUF4211 domain-containing protein n=1 Tax=Guyanagaster necrorhizus TaxID=856835 RepID=A0A9P7W5G8_9AGAR|nr:uncharacterized protein BT62DRAFT_998533 [Guyanagaster necrorhizus MCA 3950]KAG7452498.1 hypothetical protein BT62DRAFT_998533 [Guyanagaster necrorhizus MCA 3950]